MASIKDLRRRIVSTKNTQQTTKAMKMVSAAKLRRAQEAITAQRPYARRVQNLISLLASMPNMGEASPLMKRSEGTEGKRVMLVLMTSDRGLCGGFNGNVIKTASRWIKANSSRYASVSVSFVGKKGHDFFKTKTKDLGTYYQDLGGKVTFLKAKKLGESLVQQFLDGEVDEIKIIYNEFKNAVSQETQVEDFLPLPELKPAQGEAAIPFDTFLIKPDPRTLLEALLKKYFAIQAFRMMLESQASEHGARMSAMENATKNASDMIWNLTLEYNKQRQAGITKELLEIISGSESQKAS